MEQHKQLILICGDDGFLVNRKAKKLIEELVPPENRDFGLEVIDGNVENDEEISKAVNSCIEAVSTLGFFGGKTVWFKDVSFFVPKKPSDEDDGELGGNAGVMVSALLEFLKQGIPEGQTLIISTTKILRNSALFRYCSKEGEKIDFGSGGAPWELEKKAKDTLAELLKEKQLTMSSAIQDVFLERVGIDSRMILEELEKLSLYIYPRKEVKREDIAEISSAMKETVAWEIIDAFDARNARRVIKIIDELSVKKGAHMFFEAMLQNHVRDLILLRAAVDQGWIYGGTWRKDLEPTEQVILSTLLSNPKLLPSNKLSRNLRAAMNYSLLELRTARSKLMEMREKFVTSHQEPLDLLRNTMLEIINAPKR